MLSTVTDSADSNPPAQPSRPLLDLRCLIVIVLGVLAGWLAYDAGGWPAAITSGAAIIGLLYAVLPRT